MLILEPIKEMPTLASAEPNVEMTLEKMPVPEQSEGDDGGGSESGVQLFDSPDNYTQFGQVAVHNLGAAGYSEMSLKMRQSSPTATAILNFLETHSSGLSVHGNIMMDNRFYPHEGTGSGSVTYSSNVGFWDSKRVYMPPGMSLMHELIHAFLWAINPDLQIKAEQNNLVSINTIFGECKFEFCAGLVDIQIGNAYISLPTYVSTDNNQNEALVGAVEHQIAKELGIQPRKSYTGDINDHVLITGGVFSRNPATCTEVEIFTKGILEDFATKSDDTIALPVLRNFMLFHKKKNYFPYESTSYTNCR